MSTPLADTFPFLAHSADGYYSITLPSEDDEVMHRYLGELESHGLSGNGYSWEGIILQLLEQKAPSLTSEFDFDSEAGAFHCYTGNENAYRQFLHLVAPILQDSAQFTTMLSSISVDQIDD